MAFNATTQLYQREAALQNSRADQQFNTYMADLARSYGIAEGSLNANLEGRGIFRSGEASTSRTRLSAENQAMQSRAMQDRDYQKNMNDINLLKQLAALQANSNQQATANSSRFDPAPATYNNNQKLTFRNDPYYAQDPKKQMLYSEDRRVYNMRPSFA